MEHIRDLADVESMNRGIDLRNGRMNLGRVVVGKKFCSLECMESMSFGGGIVVDKNFGIEHHSNFEEVGLSDIMGYRLELHNTLVVALNLHSLHVNWPYRIEN